MRLSHVCLGCGMDMARVRALPDAATGLRIVRCPRCGAAAARRDVAGDRRRRKRFLGALLTLIRRALVGGVFLATICGWAIAIASAEDDGARGVVAELGPRALAQKPRDEIVFLLFTAGVIAIAGSWAQTALRHLTPALRWSVAAGAAIVICSADWLVVQSRNLLVGLAGGRAWDGPDGVEMAHRAAALGIAAVFVAAGAVAGVLWNRSAGARASAQWRRRLERARRRSSAA